MTMASEPVPLRTKRPKYALTKLCRFDAVNQCWYGDECNFAHGSEEIEQMPDFRKTSMCKAWRHGTCQLQSIDCRFAHCRSELRRTEVYMHEANIFQGISTFNKTLPAANGIGQHSLFDNTKVDANVFGDDNLFGNTNLDHELSNNTELEMADFEEFRKGDKSIDSAISINMQLINRSLQPSLQWYCGASVMLCNLPFEYNKNMLASEIEELGFDNPRDIVYIHLPFAFNTQLNYGHCLIVFNETNGLDAFMDVFEGRVLRHFRSENKRLMVLCKSSHGPDHGPDVSAPPSVEAKLFTDMEVTRLSEAGMDQLITKQISEFKACTGCGHNNMVIGYRFCQWCGQQ